MVETRRYEVKGTAALACREEVRGEEGFIEYDAARRAFEARQRLEARRQRAGRTCTQDIQRASRARDKRLSLQDVVEDAYQPQSSTTSFLTYAYVSLRDAVLSHPFTHQLRYGTLAGKPAKHGTNRQIFGTTVASMAFTALIVFVSI